MVRLFTKTMYVCLFLISFSLVGCNPTSTKNQLPASKPKDFNFVFKFGVDAKDQLDTVKGEYTKDMVTEPSITTNLILTDEEMNSIYLGMKKINILNYPENFTPKNNESPKPFETYSLKIIINGKEKNIYWKQGVSETKEALQLNELINKIKKIIFNKEEYKKLPPAKGAYCVL